MKVRAIVCPSSLGEKIQYMPVAVGKFTGRFPVFAAEGIQVGAAFQQKPDAFHRTGVDSSVLQSARKGLDRYGSGEYIIAKLEYDLEKTGDGMMKKGWLMMAARAMGLTDCVTDAKRIVFTCRITGTLDFDDIRVSAEAPEEMPDAAKHSGP